MKPARLCIALAVITSSAAFAQDAVEDWIRLRPGNKWIYEHETRDDTGRGPSHLEVHRWTTEETIVGSWTIPEGTLVGRHVRLVDGSPRLGIRVNPDQAYLIHDGCLYTKDVQWQPQQHQLAQVFREDLNAGHIAADFCFPLVAWKTWGAPHWADWRAPADAKDWQVAGLGPITFHITSISSYLGSGETADIWFEKGVGLVREEDIHHGTIGEVRTRLRDFHSTSLR
jgi:hypothetical protein